MIDFFKLQIAIPDANTLVQNATYHVNGSYTGILASTLVSNLYPNYSADYSSPGRMSDFASVFGVLFSGVTGIMAGANMSGELKNPGRNIPRGTLSAVLFTFLCYIVLSIMTAATSSRFLLQNNFVYMMPTNVWPPFVAVGILTATFSAGLSNLIGSSRVLEALAKDNIFGELCKKVAESVNSGNLCKKKNSGMKIQFFYMIHRFRAEFYCPGNVARQSHCCRCHFMVSRSSDTFRWLPQHHSSNKLGFVFTELFGNEPRVSRSRISQRTKF